jgi:hypothetical protein
LADAQIKKEEFRLERKKSRQTREEKTVPSSAKIHDSYTMRSIALSALALLAQSAAFAPPIHQNPSFKQPFELYGLRTFWRNRFSRRPLKTSDAFEPLDLESVVARAAIPEITTVALESHVELSTTGALTVEAKREPKPEDLSKLFTLPPPDRQLKKLEQEFRDMLIDFSQFSKRDIRAVKNPRLRALFEGVAASYSLPEVYRAFEVLFEDYAPLRIAGRLIYGKLKQVMLAAKNEAQQEVDEIVETTGMLKEDVEVSRMAFFQLVVHQDDRATEMTIQQLVDFGLAETVAEVLGYADFGTFLSSFEVDSRDKIGFSELMIGLQSCSVDNAGPECNPATVLQEVAKRMEPNSGKPDSLDQKKRAFIVRYDGMVENFKEWKSIIPEGEGRRLDVLRGCFVGAESKEIVDALRIVYVDYSALRLSGDIIFKIVAALVRGGPRVEALK